MKKTELHLLTHALDTLPRGIDVVDVQYRDQGDTKMASDAILTLRVAKHVIAVAVEIKRIHRKETLMEFQRQHHGNVLLICNLLSNFLRQYCEDNGINYLDEAGNAHIALPDLFLHIEGKTRPKANVEHNAMSIGIMKSLFALLAEDDLLNQPYERIAAKAGVSLGMVSKAMHYLMDQNSLPKDKKSRRFLDKNALITQWLKAYPQVLRPKLNPLRLRTSLAWQDIALENDDTWSGEVAAAELTHHLIPEEYWLFTRAPAQHKIREYHARPAKDGNLLIAEPFWGESLIINDNTKALLSMAELLTSQDSRNRETAEILNDQYLRLNTLP